MNNDEYELSDRINFMKQFIDKYHSPQSGGYTGKRFIKNNSETDSSKYPDYAESFKSTNKSKIFGGYAGGKKSNNIRAEDIQTEEFDVDTEFENKINKKYRSYYKNNSKKKSKRVDEETELDNNLYGGDSDNYDDSYSGETSDDENDYDLDDDADKYDDNEKEYDDEDDDDSYKDYESRPRVKRVRNPELDDLYKSFIEKIVKYMNISEEEAMNIRDAVKKVVITKNPELRGRIHDEQRLKEMESILASKNDLKKALKNVNLDEVKKEMAEMRAKLKQLKEERLAQREKNDGKKNDRSSNTRNLRDTNKNKNKNNSRNASRATSRTTSRTTSRNTNNKYKVTDNNYLLSDDVLFSPTDY